jgi:hypothetical protein
VAAVFLCGHNCKGDFSMAQGSVEQLVIFDTGATMSLGRIAGMSAPEQVETDDSGQELLANCAQNIADLRVVSRTLQRMGAIENQAA